MGAKRKQTEVGGAVAIEREEVAPSIKGDADGSPAEKTQRAASNGAKGKKERGSPEDLKQIQATFKSSMFRLQVNEMLKEVAVDYSKTAVIAAALQALKASLDALPETGAPLSPSLVSGYAAALGVPIEKLKELRVLRPAKVDVVGSFLLHTVAKPVQNVDVAMEIPKAFFHEKDYLNHRYHVKRALFLAGVAKALEANCSAFESFELVPFKGDVRKPILLLTPGKSDNGATTKFVVRIFPTIDASTFDVAKLGPKRNNLRDAKNEKGETLPTPQYSNSILEDQSLTEHSKLLHSALAMCPALGEAIVLQKVWARQRGFQDAPDSLNGFLLSMLAAHLTSAAGGKKISAHMTAYQVFKVVLNALGHSTMLEKGVFLTDPSGKSDITSAKRAALLEAFDVVVADPSGCVNLAARVTKSAVVELAREAARGLALLATDGDDDEAFDALFMTPVSSAEKFDLHVRVTTSSGGDDDDGPSALDTPSALAASDQSSTRSEEDRIEALVAKGLGERALLVRARRRAVQPGWQLGKGLPAAPEGTVLVGVSLAEPDVAFRLADVGPSADDKEEAKKFRDFWGSKAELRRFRDGTIAETAVWDCPDPTERHLVVERVVRHVLCRHLPTFPGKVEVVAGQLDEVLQEDGTDPAGVMPTLLEAFSKLSKRLRGLSDLPLKVVSVQPLSTALCHTAVFPPQPHPLAYEGDKPLPEAAEAIKSKKVPACLEPLEILLTLEGSGRWPDDPLAVQKMKAAFLIQIAKSLQDNHKVHVVAAENAVDVLTDGFAFRLALFYEKDPSRLRKPNPVLNPAATNLNKVETAAVSLESDLLLRSTHANLLQAVQGQHPAFGATVRLAKRWVSNHKFSAALLDEAVELLVASLFVNPGPYPPPKTRVTGLLRFLRLLSAHDWANSPLLVDVNADLKAADRQNIQASFERSRKQPGAGPALFVATPYDPQSATWTNEHPTPSELRRLVAYAKSSVALLRQQIEGQPDDDRWQSIFRTPLTVYDCLVLLRREALPYPLRTLFPAANALDRTPQKPRQEALSLTWLPPGALNKGLAEARQGLLIGFDPISLLRRELEESFGEYVTVCQDQHGADALGVIWTSRAKQVASQSLERKPTKRRKGQPSSGNERGEFDEAQVLGAVRSIGKGLVLDVHVVRLLSN